MHDLLVVGVPLPAILAGILLNRSEVRELRNEMVVRFDKLEGETSARFDKLEGSTNSRFDKMDARLELMNADMGPFFHLTGKLEARVESLEKNR